MDINNVAPIKKYKVKYTYLKPMAYTDRIKPVQTIKQTADIAPVKHIAPLDFA